MLTGTNPVLTRELRASLRNTRSFVLLAVYVAVLGAVAVSQFPQTITIGRTGGLAGQELFWKFTAWQAALVLVLLPALATGALAQEREQRTLQPLLLTPLTPMQIVWGKAGGVLSLTLLLLLSTLPLTSLCFLLGGVSPGEVIAAYVLLLGLAGFTAGVGLYCSARWQTTMRATVMCYLYLPFLTAMLAALSSVGAVVSSLFILGWMVQGLTLRWKQWAAALIPKFLRWLWWELFAIVLIVLFYALIVITAKIWDMGVFARMIFVTLYLVITAQYGMQRAAREIARNPDPEPALRERMEDVKEEWQRAVAPPPVYVPAPTGQYSYTPRTPPPSRRPKTATYGEQSFLPDYLNPIFARDMRGGLAGRLKYLLVFSYIVTVGTELLLPLALLSNPGASASGWFADWANFHFMILLIAGAWLGARTIAPEREQQTLPQLLTAPLLPREIVGGKMMAAMAYTFYVFVLSLPLAILLPLLGEMAWGTAFAFISVEVVIGAFAAAWGIYCSMQCLTVRRAIGWALGGVLFLIWSPSLLSAVFPPVAYATPSVAPFMGIIAKIYHLLPFNVLHGVLSVPAVGSTPIALRGATISLPLALLLYGGGTLVLLFLTSRAFKNYVRTV